jgi:hypothetical protein
MFSRNFDIIEIKTLVSRQNFVYAPGSRLLSCGMNRFMSFLVCRQINFKDSTIVFTKTEGRGQKRKEFRCSDIVQLEKDSKKSSGKDKEGKDKKDGGE